jgi:cytochrome c peroxidase
MIRALLVVCGMLAVLPSGGASGAEPQFDDAQVRRILGHGPWPPAASTDATNRLSGHADAIRLGAVLFAEPRLSARGDMACQSCHQPEKGWSDGRARSLGMQSLDRNALGLLNVRLQRWLGWDGASDSLWAASIRPILAPQEMGGSMPAVAALLRDDRPLACLMRRVDPEAMTRDDEALLVLAAKAMAAFQETLMSSRTPFDDFRDALERQDRAAASRYPAAAQRGLALFIGRGQCATCHTGPNFSNGEFHDTGLPFFVGDADGRRRVDPGRHAGIARLKENPYNLLGRHNDSPSAPATIPVRHVAQLHRNWGEFKVPGLRSLPATAPYMHDGSKATLTAVVAHYSELNEDRLHADGEAILKPLRLNAEDTADLLAFLQSLSAPDDTAVHYDRLRHEARTICP